MKKSWLMTAILATTAAWGADITGDWYGTLETPGGKLRLVLHVAKSGDGVKASMDSIDQGAPNLAADSASMSEGKFTARWANLGATYEGTVNSEATELKGTLTQGGATIPLAFNRTPFPAEAPGAPVPLSAEDRDFLLSELEMSRAEFLKAIRGLTPEQWNHRPASGGWTIAECAEHITVTEDALFQMVTQQILTMPVKAGVKRAGRTEDEAVLKRMVDRSEKAQAPEMLKPTGKFPTPASVEAAFNERRNRAVEWVKTTNEDLRGRLRGPMDAYQYLLTASGHARRHTLQINEVKQDAKYPK